MIDAYLLVMLLSSGEVVRSEVPFSYCIHYVEKMQQGETPVIDHQLVVTAICAPKTDIEKAFAKVGTQ